MLVMSTQNSSIVPIEISCAVGQQESWLCHTTIDVVYGLPKAYDPCSPLKLGW